MTKPIDELRGTLAAVFRARHVKLRPGWPQLPPALRAYEIYEPKA